MSAPLPDPPAGTSPPRRGGGVKLYQLLPLGLFACLALIFLLKLQSGSDPSTLPSALVGHAAPPFDLPALDGVGVPGLKQADLIGKVTIVNVFASWCVPCRQEQPELNQLARAFAGSSQVRLVGINYKDPPDKAAAFLDEVGNPYSAIGVDRDGRVGIDWGVYGVPETYVVDARGIVQHKFIGPLTGDEIAGELRSQIDRALAAAK
jgi:cytochrome c biogenesis protein CcmG/thiol:disulfide interchange protein DsbE